MRIDGQTRIFGVVGDPIKQAKTPTHINTIFEQRGSNIVCVPFHASSEDFSNYWQGMKTLQNVAGFGVTIPHKKRAMELCDTLGPGAEKIGVVNVVRREPDGRFHGEIFDGLSFVNGLKAEGHDPAGHRVFIYGAGGAATAICFALIDAGAGGIFIQNRTHKNAEDLVEKLKDRTGFSEVYAIRGFDDAATLVINASCLGMKECDPLPVNPSELKPAQIVTEVVANPETTRFLTEAAKIGCPVHSGIHMITNQMVLMADFIDGG